MGIDEIIDDAEHRGGSHVVALGELAVEHTAEVRAPELGGPVEVSVGVAVLSVPITVDVAVGQGEQIATGALPDPGRLLWLVFDVVTRLSGGERFADVGWNPAPLRHVVPHARGPLANLCCCRLGC